MCPTNRRCTSIGWATQEPQRSCQAYVWWSVQSRLAAEARKSDAKASRGVNAAVSSGNCRGSQSSQPEHAQCHAQINCRIASARIPLPHKGRVLCCTDNLRQDTAGNRRPRLGLEIRSITQGSWKAEQRCFQLGCRCVCPSRQQQEPGGGMHCAQRWHVGTDV